MRKIIATLLSTVLLVSLLPSAAFAASGDVSAKAAIIDAWHKGGNFQTNGVTGAITGTGIPELQLNITDAAYTQAGMSTAKEEITVILNNATLPSSADATSLVNGIRVFDEDRVDLLTTTRNGATLTLSVSIVSDNEYTITVNGVLEKGDVIAIPMTSIMTKTATGKLATVSVESDLIDVEDLMYCATAAYGIVVSIGDSVKVAQGESVTLNSKGLTIEPFVPNSYSNKAKFELKLNSGFTFTSKNSTLTLIDNTGASRTLRASDDEIEIDGRTLTIYPNTTEKFTLVGIQIEATTAKVGDTASITLTLKDTKSTGTVNISYSTLLDTTIKDVSDLVTEPQDEEEEVVEPPTFTTKVIVPIGESMITAGEETIALDVPAYISGSYTMLPVRAVAKALGVSSDSVTWNSTTKTVTIMYGTTTIKMTSGSRTITVNDVTSLASAAVEITDGRAFLPLRDLANALGVTQIDWNSSTRTATLN